MQEVVFNMPGLPEGWTYTGELRKVQPTEFYLNSKDCVACRTDDKPTVMPFPILRCTELDDAGFSGFVANTIKEFRES